MLKGDQPSMAFKNQYFKCYQKSETGMAQVFRARRSRASGCRPQKGVGYGEGAPFPPWEKRENFWTFAFKMVHFGAF